MTEWLFETLQKDTHKRMGFGNLKPFDQDAENKKLQGKGTKSIKTKKQKKDDDGFPENIKYMSISDFMEK